MEGIMEEQGDQMDIPDFQPDLPFAENQQEEFIAAMLEAQQEDAPIQVFRNLLNNAPPTVSAKALYNLAYEFLGDETDVVPLLVKYNPMIAQYKDPGAFGLLLHQAILYRASVERIELILDAYPEAISKKAGNGLLPLHLACKLQQSAPILELLRSRYPGAASVSPEEWKGQFPLHYCLQQVEMNSSNSFIMALIEACPEAVSVKSTGPYNETTLHLACENGFSLVIVKRLYQLYPGAVTIRTDCNCKIPLHRACESAHSSLEVIKFLLQKCPRGAQMIDGLRRLPLHHAARRQEPLEAIQILIELYPDAVNATNRLGELPVHIACAAGASVEVIQLLLDRFVGGERHHNGLSITDNTGKLPIHGYVGSQSARPETLQHLLELYPGGINAVNIYDSLPLHYACDSSPPRLEIVRLLAEAAPYTVIQKSAYGGLPIEHAWSFRNREAVDVVEYLVERQNEVVLAMKNAFKDVADTQLGLPDLVIANIWGLAKPDLWAPDEKDWEAFHLHDDDESDY